MYSKTLTKFQTIITYKSHELHKLLIYSKCFRKFGTNFKSTHLNKHFVYRKLRLQSIYSVKRKGISPQTESGYLFRVLTKMKIFYRNFQQSYFDLCKMQRYKMKLYKSPWFSFKRCWTRRSKFRNVADNTYGATEP